MVCMRHLALASSTSAQNLGIMSDLMRPLNTTNEHFALNLCKGGAYFIQNSSLTKFVLTGGEQRTWRL